MIAINILIGTLIVLGLVKDSRLTVAPPWHRLGLVLIAAGLFADAYCDWHTSAMGYCPYEFRVFDNLTELGVLLLVLYYVYLLMRRSNEGEGVGAKGRHKCKG